MRIAMLLFGFAALFATSAAASDAPDLEAWIRDLGARDWGTRRDTHARLVGWGAARIAAFRRARVAGGDGAEARALAALETLSAALEAACRSDDLERARRARAICGRLRRLTRPRILLVSAREGTRALYLLDAEGGDPERLADDGAEYDDPAFSPDGTRIVARRRAGEGGALWSMSATGGDGRPLAEGIPHDPVFSPDGSRVAFACARDGNLEIYDVAAGGGAVRRLTDHPERDQFPTYSPDGRRIAYVSLHSGRADLWAMDADGTNAAPLADSPAMDREPSFSPDGARLLFTSDRHGPTELFLADAEGRSPKRLTDDGFADRRPRFCPDGRRIAYLSHRGDKSQLVTLDLDGAARPVLRTGARKAGSCATLAWSPDGTRIAYERSQEL